MEQEKLCKRCGKPVEVFAADYDLFEQMHWLCFHLEFEHEGDPDEAGEAAAGRCRKGQLERADHVVGS